MLDKVPYDERISGYGYEDVLLGKALRENGIKVNHIDNPVVYTEFEDNEQYLRKVEEALRTLHQFEEDLKGYSPLLKAQGILDKFHLLPILKTYHALASKWELKILHSKKPSLFCLKLYKLGYYVSL